MTRRAAPTITKLGLTCFRLVAVYGEPGEPPYAARLLRSTTTRMGVIARAGRVRSAR